MLSHILGFKGLQGPDLFSSTPQHHLPPLFALGNALGQSSAASLSCLGSPSACRLVGGGLGWGGGKVGQALSLLSCPATRIWFSLRGLRNMSSYGRGFRRSQCERAAAPCSSTLPGHGVAQTLSVLWTLCVCIQACTDQILNSSLQFRPIYDSMEVST